MPAIGGGAGDQVAFSAGAGLSRLSFDSTTVGSGAVSCCSSPQSFSHALPPQQPPSEAIVAEYGHPPPRELFSPPLPVSVAPAQPPQHPSEAALLDEQQEGVSSELLVLVNVVLPVGAAGLPQQGEAALVVELHPPAGQACSVWALIATTPATAPKPKTAKPYRATVFIMNLLLAH